VFKSPPGEEGDNPKCLAFDSMRHYAGVTDPGWEEDSNPGKSDGVQGQCKIDSIPPRRKNFILLEGGWGRKGWERPDKQEGGNLLTGAQYRQQW